MQSICHWSCARRSVAGTSPPDIPWLVVQPSTGMSVDTAVLKLGVGSIERRKCIPIVP